MTPMPMKAACGKAAAAARTAVDIPAAAATSTTPAIRQYCGPAGQDRGFDDVAQPDGRPIDPDGDWDEWKALLAEAGITKDGRLHDARHTSGTLLGEQHVDLHVIQRILGHAEVSTTRICTDPTDPLTRGVVGGLGGPL
jgi:integrase